jgi:hypothetical protein
MDQDSHENVASSAQVLLRRSLIEDEPGLAVDELACRIKVTGVARRLGDDVQDGFAHVLVPPIGPTLRPVYGRAVEGRRRNKAVRYLNFVPVQVEDVLYRDVRPHAPCTFRLVHHLAGKDVAEPETLDIEGKVLHQPNASPPGGQDRPAQVIFRQAVQGPEHMASLLVQRGEQRLRLPGRCLRSVHFVPPLRAATGLLYARLRHYGDGAGDGDGDGFSRFLPINRPPRGPRWEVNGWPRSS